MSTLIVLAILCYGGYKLRKAAPAIGRFALEHADMCRAGGSVLKRMFSR